MQTVKVVVGAALLAFALLLSLGVLILFVIDIFAIVGVVILMDGVGYFLPAETLPKALGKQTLSALDLSVLKLTAEGKSQDEVAKATGVSPGTVSEKIAMLSTGGFLAGNFLTEKGFEAVKGA